ncbi:hypothetical protein HN51_000642 [Arachis hypogaea]
METKTIHFFLPLLATFCFFSHNIVVPVISSTTTFEDNKNYYITPTPDPSIGTPPSSGSLSPQTPSSPSHGSGHGSSPSHGSPSHGGSSSNCGSPPPSHSGGGGYYNSPPSTPTPTTPIDPGTPSIPSPPFLPTPSPFSGGTCNFWSNHPGLIFGVLGWWGTLGNAFGVTSIPGMSSGITLPQALSNTRKDGIGALLREGTASYLNSLVNHKFPYTTSQVRDQFAASITSNKAAAAQAQLFKMANEGRSKPNF